MALQDLIFNPSEWTDGSRDIKGLFGTGFQAPKGEQLVQDVLNLQKMGGQGKMRQPAASQQPGENAGDYYRRIANEMRKFDPAMAQEYTDKANEWDLKYLQFGKPTAEKTDMAAKIFQNVDPTNQAAWTQARNTVLQYSPVLANVIPEQASPQAKEAILRMSSATRDQATPQGMQMVSKGNEAVSKMLARSAELGLSGDVAGAAAARKAAEDLSKRIAASQQPGGPALTENDLSIGFNIADPASVDNAINGILALQSPEEQLKAMQGLDTTLKGSLSNTALSKLFVFKDGEYLPRPGLLLDENQVSQALGKEVASDIAGKKLDYQLRKAGVQSALTGVQSALFNLKNSKVEASNKYAQDFINNPDANKASTLAQIDMGSDEPMTKLINKAVALGLNIQDYKSNDPGNALTADIANLLKAKNVAGVIGLDWDAIRSAVAAESFNVAARANSAKERYDNAVSKGLTTPIGGSPVKEEVLAPGVKKVGNDYYKGLEKVNADGTPIKKVK